MKDYDDVDYQSALEEYWDNQDVKEFLMSELNVEERETLILYAFLDKSKYSINGLDERKVGRIIQKLEYALEEAFDDHCQELRDDARINAYELDKDYAGTY